jgi:hypothetical protein
VGIKPLVFEIPTTCYDMGQQSLDRGAELLAGDKTEVLGNLISRYPTMSDTMFEKAFFEPSSQKQQIVQVKGIDSMEFVAWAYPGS